MKKKAILVIIFFGVTFITAGPLLVDYGFRLADIETRKMAGELLPFEIDSQKPVEIQAGGIHVLMTFDELSEGFNLTRYVYLGFDYPFRISLKDGRFLISVDIKNANGETIAKIVNDQWVVNNDNAIARDRNYNSYAFEVIDSDLVPVIQIILSPQNKMYLGGFFYVPDNTLLLTDNRMILGPSLEDIALARAQTIFKYPSEEHLGEMVVKSTYQVIRVSTWWIAIGAILTALAIPLDSYTIYLGLSGLSGLFKKRITTRLRKAQRRKRTKVRSSNK